MSSELKLKSLVKPALEGKTVGDQSLPERLGSAEIEEPFSMATDAITFNLGGDIAIDLFNAASDEDEDDKVFGTLVKHEPGTAVLKYSAGVHGKLAGSAAVSAFGLKFSGSAKARTFSYRRHPSTKKVAGALAGDAQSPRFAFIEQHVQSLSPGEAVGFRVGGVLTLGLEATWSHVYSNALGALSSLLADGALLSLEIGPSATASFELEVKDDFFVAFSRSDAEAIELEIRRSESASQSSGAELAVAVKLANPDDLAPAVEAALDALAGGDWAAVKAALTSPATDSDLVADLLERLDDSIAGGYDLSDLAGVLERRVEDIVQKAAEATIKVAFVYDYSRTTAESTVLSASLSGQALSRLHGDVLRGRVNRVLAAAGDEVSIRTFVRELATTVKHSWGFGFSIGDWLELEGADEKTFTTKRTAKWLDGAVHEQAALSARRRYKGSTPSERWSWSVELAGSMECYSAAAAARADELDWGLALVVGRAHKTLSNDELRAELDLSELFGIVSPIQVRPQYDELRQAFAGAKNVEFTHQLKLGERATDQLSYEASLGRTERFARMLARAMPWTDRYDRARDDPDRRERLYADIWQEYIEEPYRPPEWLALRAKSKFRWSHPTLADAEANGYQDPYMLAFLGRQDVRGALRSFAEGADTLRRLIRESRPVSATRSPAKRLVKLGAQGHWVRALGAFVADIVEAAPYIADDVSATTTVAFDRDGKRHTRVLSAVRKSG